MKSKSSQSCKINSSNGAHSQARKKLRLNYFSQAFQLRYGVWLATIGAFCFFLMGYLMHLSIQHAVQDSPSSGAVREALGAFLSPRTVFLRYDVLLPAAILVVFLVAIGIVGTHRIAGPLFAIKRHMNRVRRGRTRLPLKLRHGDELMDVAASLNALLIDQWNFEHDVEVAVDEALSLLESGRTAPSAHALRELRARLEARRTPLPEKKEASNPNLRRKAA
jgi:hypothetical protein